MVSSGLPCGRTVRARMPWGAGRSVPALLVLAVAASLVSCGSAGGDGSGTAFARGIEQALVAADGRGIRVPATPGSCGRVTLDAEESASRVVLRLSLEADRDLVCPAVIRTVMASTTLEHPLGNRDLVDGDRSGRSVPFVDGARLHEPGRLPAGYVQRGDGIDSGIGLSGGDGSPLWARRYEGIGGRAPLVVSQCTCDPAAHRIWPARSHVDINGRPGTIRTPADDPDNGSYAVVWTEGGLGFVVMSADGGSARPAVSTKDLLRTARSLHPRTRQGGGTA